MTLGASALRISRPKSYVAPSAPLIATRPMQRSQAAPPPLLREEDYAKGYLMAMNLPPKAKEEDLRELFTPFGALRSFQLLLEDSGASKGVALLCYEDEAVADVAKDGLSGIPLGDRTLAMERVPKTVLDAMRPKGGGGGGAAAAEDASEATAVVRLVGVLTAAMAADAAERREVCEDVKGECERHGGPVEDVRVAPGGEVYVHFGGEEDAGRARAAMDQRRFDGRQVVATFAAEEDAVKGAPLRPLAEDAAEDAAAAPPAAAAAAPEAVVLAVGDDDMD